MLKIAVCDDSPLFLELAIKFINKWSEERQFPVSISSYNNGDDLLAANAEERMDIIFSGHYHASFEWHGYRKRTSSDG